MQGMDAEALLDSVDAGVVVLGPDGRIGEWTAAAARLTGIAAGLALGQNFWAAFPAIRTSEVERAFEDVGKDGVSRRLLVAGREQELPGILWEFQIARPANQGLTILFHRVRGGVGGRITASYGRADDQAYIDVFDALPVAALLLSPTGVIIDANPVAADLLHGPTPRALRGRTLVEWFDDPVLQEALGKAGKFPTHLSTLLETGSAGPREIRGVLAPLVPGAVGSTLLLTATDISREQILQKKLIQAGRLSQLGALVAGVAHELNNPLAAISAFADAVAADARQTDLIESAAIIHAEAVRAGRIVRTLLDYARQRRTALGPVNLRDTVERVLALQWNALRKSGVRVDLNIAADFPPVRGDSQELQQVFLNAIVNAQQAVAEVEGRRVIEIRATRTDGAALVTIDDSGSGVPPELLDQVFDPFFTTKGDRGTGLGLAISFGLVGGMGGRMWMQNIEGGGARLAIELLVETSTPEAVPPEAGGGPMRPLSLLVVEDQENVRRGMMLMARRLGHSAAGVATVEEAIRRLHSGESEFNALVVDVHLDEANTGFDLYQALEREGRGWERRIVFATGDSISVRTRDLLERAGRPVLRKPFGLQDLREVLDRMPE